MTNSTSDTLADHLRALNGQKVKITLLAGETLHGELEVHGDYVTLKGQPGAHSFANVGSIVPADTEGPDWIAAMNNARKHGGVF